MNNLSVLIYISQISENLSGASESLCFMSAILIALSGLVVLIARIELGHHPELAIKLIKISFLVFFVTGTVHIFVPSRETTLLIAASEIGERTLNSQRAGKVLDGVVDPGIDLLNAWIAKQTADLRANTKPKQ
jgi:hypothetical protein